MEAVSAKTKNENLIGHLEALRRVILISVLAIIAASVLIYAFGLDKIMMYISAPISRLGLDLVMIGVAEGFLVRVKIAVFSGFGLALPIIIWQVFSFVMPALYPHEKKVVLPLTLSSVGMFALGVFFAYRVVLDVVLNMLLIEFASDLSPMISYDKYLSFLMWLLLPFGFVFQIPIVVLILSKIGVLNAKLLQKNRKIVIIGSFVAAAFLSPGGDIISQILMAVPIVVLYELSILLTRIAIKDKKRGLESGIQ